MVKSEAIILNKGYYSNGSWINVTIQLRYPLALPNGTSQSSINNPLAVNDYIVDNNGFIWKVTSCTSSGSNFVCTLTEQSTPTPSGSMEPNISLDKGLTVTPNSKGLLSPYYHDSYVSTNSFRAAMAHNMKIYSGSSSGGGGTGGTLPTSITSVANIFATKKFLIMNDMNGYSWMCGWDAFGGPLGINPYNAFTLIKTPANEAFKIKTIDNPMFSLYNTDVNQIWEGSPITFIRTTDNYPYITNTANFSGEAVLGHNTTISTSEANKLEGSVTCSKVVMTGTGTVVKLSTGGNIFWGGNGMNGTLGWTGTRNYFTQFNDSSTFIDIAAAYNTIFLVKQDGRVIINGDTLFGEHGRLAESPKYLKKIYSYLQSMYGIDQNNMLWFWGRDIHGLLKNIRSDVTGYTSLPLQVSTSIQFAKVSIGNNHCVGLATNGDVYTWGKSGYYCLGNGVNNTAVEVYTPFKLASNCIDVCAMPFYATFYVTNSNRLYGLGYNNVWKSFGPNYSAYEYLSTPVLLI